MHDPELIARAGRTLDDISRIVIVRGPGPYGALRIGVTTANILGLALNSKLFEIETEALGENSIGAFLASGKMGKAAKLVSPKYLLPPKITKPKKR